jgi:hypothetical protein
MSNVMRQLERAASMWARSQSGLERACSFFAPQRVCVNARASRRALGSAGAWPFFPRALGAALCPAKAVRAATVGLWRCACATSVRFATTAAALYRSSRAPRSFGPVRSAAAPLFFRRAAHNPSIERTNNGGPRLAVSPAVCAPLFAAHVER